MTTLIKKNIQAKLKDNNIEATINRLNIQVHPGFRGIKIELKGFSQAALLKSKPITIKIVTTYKIESGVGGVQSIIYNFTINDLIDNKLRRTHNFNQGIVDASVIDNVGQEIMVGAEIINDNIIELDFSRADIQGVWKLLIEK